MKSATRFGLRAGSVCAAVVCALAVTAWAAAHRGAPIVAFGLSHHPVGMATIDWNPVERRFPIMNLGSSGEDGATIDLGTAEGFSMDWDPLTPNPGATALLRISATGQGAGVPPGPMGTVSIVGPCIIPGCPFCVCITADYSAIGSTTQHIEVWRNGQHVETFTGVTGMAATASEWPTGCDKGPARIGPIRTTCYRPRWPQPVALTIGGSGGPTVMGDELRILAENPAAEFLHLYTWTVQAAEFPVMVITHEAPNFREMPFSALGQAVLAPSPAQMVVENLGSSGQDGVRMECGPSDAVSLDWAELVGCWPPPACQEPPPPPDLGSILRMSFTGSHGGVPGQYLGETHVQHHISGSLEITADYSPVGATLHHIQVLLNGAIVTEVFDHTGTAAFVDEWPDGCGKGGAGTGAQRVACGRWKWRPPIIISIPGLLGPVVGDEIRILAQNPSAAFNYVETLSVESVLIPAIVLTDASRTAHTPCPADLTGDNLVGSADLATLLGSWGQMGSPADLDGNGVVGSGDLANLLGSWGVCA